MKRALPILFVLLAFLLPLLIAVVVVATRQGGAQVEQAVDHPEDPGSRQQGVAALQKFYDQKLKWSACRSYECTQLKVPLDYAKPEGRQIELAVLRNPADVPSRRVGDLVVNPGGPGAGGTWYALGSGDGAYFGAEIYERFDVIGFDPRGTGESAPIDCVSDRELDDYLASEPVPDSPAEVAEYVAGTDAFLGSCVRRSGDLALHVSTHEAARDMDVLRAALGNARLDYIGTSYGTKLGATYADLFPKRAGRMVLDAAVDPQASARSAALQQAHGFEVALTAYVDDCVASDSCYLGGSRDEALAKIRSFLESVEEKPLVVGDRQLTGGLAFYGLIQPLYSHDLWTDLDDALEAAIGGDGSGLLHWSDTYNSRGRDGRYVDNASEAILNISCLDDPTAVDSADVPGDFAAFDKASPTFGRIWAWGQTGCAAFQDLGLPRPDWKLEAKGAAPIIVIGTSRDPATPVEWAEALARQLESGVLITRDGDGHGGYHAGNACVDDAVEAYLIEGTAPKADLSC